MTDLERENRELRARLEEAEETLRAIRAGEADALVVQGAAGERVYTLEGADHGYRVLVEEMSEGAVSLDDAGTIVFSNARFARMLGLPLEQVIGSRVESWAVESDRDRLRDLLATAGELSAEIGLVRSDGASMSAQVSATKLSGADAGGAFGMVFTDLTERRRARELAAEQRLSRAIFDRTAEALVVCSDDGLIRDANAVARQLGGEGPLIGQRFDERFDLRTGSGRLSVRDEELVRAACSLRAGDRDVELLASSRVIVGGDGHVLARVVILSDVTELVTLASELSRSEARLRTTLYSIGDAVIRTGPTGTVEMMNRTAEELTGWREPAAVGRALTDVYRAVSERSGEPLVDPVSRSLRGGSVLTTDGHTVLVAKDGRRVPITESGAPIHDEAHGIVGMVLVFRDQTAERAQEAELLRSKARVERILDTMADGISLIGPDCQVLFANEALRRELGSPDGRTCHEYLRGNAQPCEQCPAERVRRGETAALEWRDERRGKQLEVHMTPFDNPDGGEAVFVLLRDVTERNELRAQLAQADRLSSMGLLAAGVAHEINNPLAYTLYNLETVVEDLQEVFQGFRRSRRFVSEPSPESADKGFGLADLEDMLERAQEALQGARRIKTISRTLGTFSRVEEGEIGPIDLHHAVQNARNLAHNEIRYRAKLVVDLGATPTVLGSEGKLSQVFLNLLINAAHAIEEGDVEGNVIRVRSYAEHDHVVVEVSDTGCGIAEADIGHLFEPFFTTKPIGQGSGLGLSISKKIVKEMGGDIWCESERGRGTTFGIRLPVMRGEGRGATAGEEARPERPSADPRGRVLVVDDEAGVRAALGRMLRSRHDVLTASSGAQGREILERDQQFDAVILDLMMPKVSGMDLHRWLARTHPALARRTVFVTGGVFTPAARAYLSQVDNLRLEKPLDTEAFRSIVDELVVGRSKTTAR